MRWMLLLFMSLSLPALADLDYSLKPRQIAEDTWLLEGSTDNFAKANGGNIVNTAFIVTEPGVVVIDTGPSKRYGEAMRKAIGETERRRAKQVAYNAEQGITPKGVQKRIKDIIDGVYDVEEGRRELAAAQTQAKYEAMPGKDLEKELKLLEKQMLDAAKNLEFEKAAALRDKLYKLKERLFGVALPTET